MKKAWKSLIALGLALLLVLALVPLAAWAEEAAADVKVEDKKDGKTGEEKKKDKTVYRGDVAGEMVQIWNGDEFVEIFERYPNIHDRYLETNRVWAGRIGLLPENGSISFNAGDWYSFNVFVADAIAERPDVAVEFGFFNESGERVSLKIPAGTDVKGLMDGKEVMEFKALADALGVDTPAYTN